MTEHSGNAPQPVDQVLRFVFANGSAAERRGTDETVALAFAVDEDCLIDYVLSMNIVTGECAFFTREDDDQHEAEEIWTFRSAWSKGS